MKVSLHWLKQYVTLDASAEEITHAITFLGFEVEQVIRTGVPPLPHVVVGEVLTRLQKIMKDAGFYNGPAFGQMDEATQIALNAFVGNENFEERCDIMGGWIDQPVFDFLVKKHGN